MSLKITNIVIFIIIILLIWTYTFPLIHTLINIPLYDYYIGIATIDDTTPLDHDKSDIFSVKTRHMLKRKTLPWLTIASIHLPNLSKTEAIFIGGGTSQNDSLLIYDKRNNKWVNVIHLTNLSDNESTYAAISIDIDKDGYEDLIVARHSGVYLYKNTKDNLNFKKIKIMTPKNNRIPIAIALADYNTSDNANIHVSKFINPTFIQTEQKGNQNIKLHDKKNKNTVNYNEHKQNMDTSSYIDIDKNGFPKIILSPDTGEVQLYENINGEKLIKKNINHSLGEWLDIVDNNIDNTKSDGLYTDRLAKQQTHTKKTQRIQYNNIVLSNNGKFNEYPNSNNNKDFPLLWGSVYENIEINTQTEFLATTNVIYYPEYKTLKEDMQIHMEKAQKYPKLKKYIYSTSTNKAFSVNLTRATKKISNVNIYGPPKTYINKNDYYNNYFNVKLPHDEQFKNSLIQIDYDDNKVQTKRNIQWNKNKSNIVSFGLGRITHIDRLMITTNYDSIYKFNNLKANQTFTFKQQKLSDDSDFVIENNISTNTEDNPYIIQ